MRRHNPECMIRQAIHDPVKVSIHIGEPSARDCICIFICLCKQRTLLQLYIPAIQTNGYILSIFFYVFISKNIHVFFLIQGVQSYSYLCMLSFCSVFCLVFTPIFELIQIIITNLRPFTLQRLNLFCMALFCHYDNKVCTVNGLLCPYRHKQIYCLPSLY